MLWSVVSSAASRGGGGVLHHVASGASSSRRTVSGRTLAASSRRTSTTSASRRWKSSSKDSSQLPPPLPPKPATATATATGAASNSPAQAKRAYLETNKKITQQNQDPIQRMAELQKELDVVRDRAAHNLELKLQKSAYHRLTDPLRRHHHALINVGAVLLAYILAHNLYQSSKSVESSQAESEMATLKHEELQTALQLLLDESTLQDIATACANDLTSEETGGSRRSSSSWFGVRRRGERSNNTQTQTNTLAASQLKEVLQTTLHRELTARIANYVMTDEERRRRDLQFAWQDSQAQLEEQHHKSPEQMLLDAVLNGEEEALMSDGNATTANGSNNNNTKRHVFSM